MNDTHDTPPPNAWEPDVALSEAERDLQFAEELAMDAEPAMDYPDGPPEPDEQAPMPWHVLDYLREQAAAQRAAEPEHYVLEYVVERSG